MSTITVKAYAPDREVRGTLAARGQVTLEFKPQAYERYNETVLANRLTELAERLTAGCREGRRQAALSKGLTVETEPHWDAGVRRFREVRDRMPVEWTSPTGAVTLSCRGLRDWHVALKSGALDKLSEAEFCNEVRLAAAGVWWRYQRKLALLRKKRREAASAERP